MKALELPGGLSILPADRAAALRATIIAVLGVTAFIAVLDGLVFRAALPADYVTHYTSPLWPRTLAACLASGVEELKYRLLAMTALVALPGLVGRRASAGWIVFAIFAAQFVNVGALVLAMPLYATFRLWLVGAVWGWLYWRHGFVSALAGHGLCHLLLDPALLWVLTLNVDR